MEMQQGLVLWPCKLNQLKPVEMIRVKLKITYNSNNGIPPPPPFFFTENTAFLSENWNFTIELSTGSIKIKHSLLLYKHFIQLLGYIYLFAFSVTI